MIIARTNKYGLDNRIYHIQRELQRNLPWFDNLDSNQVLIYGKVYKNTTPLGQSPEIFDSGKDYIDGMVSDKTAAQIAFIVQSKRHEGAFNEAVIDVVCTCDVSLIHSNDDYDTERVYGQFKRVLENTTIEDIEEGHEGVVDVFRGFNQEGLEYTDMAPRYVFSISCVVNYSDNIGLTRVATTQTALTADTIEVNNNTITIDQLTI